METAAVLTQNHEETPKERVKRVAGFFSLMSYILGFFTVLIIQELNQDITAWLAYSTFENNTRIEELAPSIKSAPNKHGGTVGCELTDILTLTRKYIDSEIRLAELTSER